MSARSINYAKLELMRNVKEIFTCFDHFDFTVKYEKLKYQNKKYKKFMVIVKSNKEYLPNINKFKLKFKRLNYCKFYNKNSECLLFTIWTYEELLISNFYIELNETFNEIVSLKLCQNWNKAIEFMNLNCIDCIFWKNSAISLPGDTTTSSFNDTIISPFNTSRISSNDSSSFNDTYQAKDSSNKKENDISIHSDISLKSNNNSVRSKVSSNTNISTKRKTNEVLSRDDEHNPVLINNRVTLCQITNIHNDHSIVDTQIKFNLDETFDKSFDAENNIAITDDFQFRKRNRIFKSSTNSDLQSLVNLSSSSCTQLDTFIEFNDKETTTANDSKLHTMDTNEDTLDDDSHMEIAHNLPLNNRSDYFRSLIDDSAMEMTSSELDYSNLLNEIENDSSVKNLINDLLHKIAQDSNVKKKAIIVDLLQYAKNDTSYSPLDLFVLSNYSLRSFIKEVKDELSKTRQKERNKNMKKLCYPERGILNMFANQNNKQWVKEIIDWYNDCVSNYKTVVTKSLYLYGPSGVGKTTVIDLLLNNKTESIFLPCMQSDYPFSGLDPDMHSVIVFEEFDHQSKKFDENVWRPLVEGKPLTIRMKHSHDKKIEFKCPIIHISNKQPPISNCPFMKRVKVVEANESCADIIENYMATR